MSEHGTNTIDYARPKALPTAHWAFYVVMANCGISFGLVMLTVLTPMCSRPTKLVHQVKCGTHLRTIGQYMLVYAHKNNGMNPDSIQELAAFAISDGGSDVLCCPAHSAIPASGPTTQAAIADFNDGGNLSYVYLGGGTATSVPRNQVLAYEPLSNHGDGMNVLLGDGTVQYLRGSDAQAFNAQIASGISPLFWPATQPIK